MAIFIKEVTIDALKQVRRGYGFAKRTSRLFLSGVLASNVGYEAIVDSEGKGNYTSLQAALDAGKTKIFIRAGTYIIDAAVTITKSNILIVGEDWSNTILKAKVALNDSIIVLGDDSNSYSNITIYNLQIDGDQANQTGGTSKGLIHIKKGISHLLIERCDIKNMYSVGIYATGASATVLSNSSIIGCKIHDAKQNIGSPDGAGIIIDYSEKLIIKDNYIYECGAGGGIDIDDTSEIIITNNFVYSTKNGGGGISIGSSYGTVNGNRIKDNESMGIFCNGGYMTITGNHLQNNNVSSGATNKAEILVRNYTTIISNIIHITTSSRSVYGIYIDDAYNTITGNTAKDDTGAATGIYLNGDNNEVVGNMLNGFSTDINDQGSNNVQYVDTATNQSIAGLKTFSTIPRIPTDDPTAAAEVISKNYLDTKVTLPGTVSMYAGTGTPVGWLTCNGAAVSRTTYATLFAVIGTAFGVGDGSTTFNVPNFKGSVAVGKDTGQSEFNVRGETGGVKTHALSAGELASHKHNLTLDGISNDAYVVANSGGDRFVDRAPGGDDRDECVTRSAGSGNAHQNLQPYLVLDYIIKF